MAAKFNLSDATDIAILRSHCTIPIELNSIPHAREYKSVERCLFLSSISVNARGYKQWWTSLWEEKAETLPSVGEVQFQNFTNHVYFMNIGGKNFYNGPAKVFSLQMMTLISNLLNQTWEIRIGTTTDPKSDWCGLCAEGTSFPLECLLNGMLFIVSLLIIRKGFQARISVSIPADNNQNKDSMLELAL